MNDLVKACEEEFGVSASAGVVVAAAGDGAAAEEEKDEFDVELTEVRDREAARQSYVHNQKANEGKVTVSYNPSENQERNNQTEGEYVDFEEIK